MTQPKRPGDVHLGRLFIAAAVLIVVALAFGSCVVIYEFSTHATI